MNQENIRKAIEDTKVAAQSLCAEGKRRFLSLNRKGKAIVISIAGLLILLCLRGGCASSSAAKVVDRLIREDMSRREELFSTLGIERYEILRADFVEDSHEDGVMLLEGAIRFIPEEALYTPGNDQNEMLNFGAVGPNKWIGEDCEKEFKKFNDLYSKWNSTRIYSFRESPLEAYEGHLVIRFEISMVKRGFSWEPKYDSRELAVGTYFDIGGLCNLFVKDKIRSRWTREEIPMIVLCDVNDKPQTKKGKKGMEEYKKAFAEINSIFRAWSELVRDDSVSGNAKAEKFKKMLSRLNLLLENVPGRMDL